MTTIEKIEYRQETSKPNIPGWYYAKFKHYNIEPVYVADYGMKLIVMLTGVTNTQELDEFKWYGEVSEVREG